MDRQTLSMCFHNVLFVEETAYGLLPRRHTDRQCEYYRGVNYGVLMREKALMTAGVTLEFDTDAPRITLNYRIADGYPNGDRTRNSSLDVYVNNVLTAQETLAISPADAPREAVFTLGEGKKRVQIWLPHTFICEIGDILLPAGAYLSPAPQRARKILFLGDSITQGIGAEYAAMGYAMQAARRLDCEAVNQSIAALRFESESMDCAGFMPDLISVAYGTNDWSHRVDRDDYDAYADAFFARMNALYPNVPVAVLSPVKRCRGESDQPADRPNLYKESELFAALQKACAPYPQMRAFDGWTLMPHTAPFFADGLHPNDLGASAYGQSVADILQGML